MASCYPAGSVAGVRELLPRDIAVSENRIDFGKKGGNPMATVGVLAHTSLGREHVCDRRLVPGYLPPYLPCAT